MVYLASPKKHKHRFRFVRWVEHKLSLKKGTLTVVTPNDRVVLAAAIGLVAIPCLTVIEIAHIVLLKSFEINIGLALASVVSFVLGMFTGKSFSL